MVDSELFVLSRSDESSGSDEDDTETEEMAKSCAENADLDDHESSHWMTESEDNELRQRFCRLTRSLSVVATNHRPSQTMRRSLKRLKEKSDTIDNATTVQAPEQQESVQEKGRRSQTLKT